MQSFLLPVYMFFNGDISCSTVLVLYKGGINMDEITGLALAGLLLAAFGFAVIAVAKWIGRGEIK